MSTDLHLLPAGTPSRHSRIRLWVILSAWALFHAAVPARAAEGDARVVFYDDYGASTSGAEDDSAWAKISPNYSVVEDPTAKQGRALRIKVPGFLQVVLGDTPIRKGRAYSVRLRMMALGSQTVEVWLRGRGSPYTKFLRKSVNVSEQWREVSFAGEVNMTRDTVGLFLMMQTSTVLWVDFAEVVELPPEYKRPPDPEPDLGNMLHNSGAELGKEGWYFRGDIVVPDSGAHGGRRCFSLGPKAVMSSSWYRLAVGRSYRVSGWCRADEPKSKVRLGVSAWVHKEKGRAITKVFGPPVGEWQRMAFEFTVPTPMVSADSEMYFVAQNYRNEGGHVWIDDLMLSPVDTPAEYAPVRPVELRVRSRGPKGCHTVGTGVWLDVHAYSPDASELPRTTTLVVSDEASRTVRRTQVALSTEGRGSARLDDMPTGHWRVDTVTGLPETQCMEGETFVAVAPEMPNVPLSDWILGGHMNTHEESLRAAFICGVRWDRCHDMWKATKWSYVERTPGDFTFDDEAIDLRRKLGIGILGNFADIPPDIQKELACRTTRTAPLVILEPHLERWRRYVRETASHWRGVITAWEIMNEPQHYRIRPQDGDKHRGRWYKRLSEIVVEETARAAPGATVVGLGGVNFMYRDLWSELGQAKAMAIFDVVSVHSYGTGTYACNRSPRPYMDAVEQVRELAREAGRNPVVWDTESGFGVRGATRKYRLANKAAPYESAGSFVKMLVARRAAGVGKWFMFNMSNQSHAGNRGLPFYFVFNDTVSPPAVSLAVAVSLLQTAQFEQLEEGDDGTIRVVFRQPEGWLQVLWNVDRSVTIDLPETARALSLWGRPITPDNKRLKVTTQPVYVLGPDAQ